MSIGNILNQPVLALNSLWQAISEEKTVRRAFEDLMSGSDIDGVWVPAFRAMDIELSADGELVYANPVDWNQWLDLPVRPGDDFINTGKRFIRVPRVMITSRYSKAPVRAVSLSNAAVKKRDKYECQYCHKLFPTEELNIDHVIPQHHGGENTWENMVCSCIKCNSKKGHKFNHEIGYKLRKQPGAPMPVSVTAINRAKFPEWRPFLPTAK